MSGPLADFVFFLLVAATASAHVRILRSTVRGMRLAGKSHSFWEWTWAVLPAIGLVILFFCTWQAMHPDSISITIPGTAFRTTTS